MTSVDGGSWDPEQYLTFSDHRLRPALELLARVPLESPRIIVDLGCGTGNVTRILKKRWRKARVIGIDRSEEMLERALPDSGSITWCRADIASWEPGEPPDLVVSNAALHWVPGHEDLFPRLARSLAPEGCLAVQMPLSWDAPSHRLLRQTLAEGGPGGAPFGPESLRAAVTRRPVQHADFYYELLAGNASHLDLWETEYLQILRGKDPVFEWVKGTALRPVLDALSGDELERFLQVYRDALRKAYPPREEGGTLYPFRRLFIVARI